MMSQAEKDLAAVAGLGKETIGRMCAAFNHVLVSDPRRVDLLKDIAGRDLDDDTIESVLNVFYNFVSCASNSNGMTRRIYSCDLSSDEKAVLNDMLHEISRKVAPSGPQDWMSHAEADARTSLAGAARTDPNHANRKAFEEFARLHAGDARFKDKYVAFVHGKYAGSGAAMIPLVHRMYDKFGNVPMHVDTIRPREQKHIIAMLPWP